MRLINHHKIVVAPVESLQINLTGFSTQASKVSMIEDVEVEPVFGKDVASIIDRVQRPVIAELLRAEHQDAIISEFIVLDDGQRLKGFAQSNAVSDDTAVILLDLVDSAENAVPLKSVQLTLHEGIFDPCFRLDDLVFFEFAEVFAEYIVQREEIHQFWGLAGENAFKLRHEVWLHILRCLLV